MSLSFSVVSLKCVRCHFICNLSNYLTLHHRRSRCSTCSTKLSCNTRIYIITSLSNHWR
uniref:Uncharacterized protein n=1 Tax=uncultured marine virus TaxID=186617 RepID=A0A0F7L8H4_9VIRU|nr:hypothetical protein [uncultured marine virus]